MRCGLKLMAFVGAWVTLWAAAFGNKSELDGWPELRDAEPTVPVLEDRRSVLLRRRTIRTEAAEAGQAHSGRVQDKGEAGERERVTRRGTAVYIVQFQGGVGKREREMVRRAGGRCLGYIPHDALLVECPVRRVNELAAAQGTRWIGVYRGEDKLDSAVARFVQKGRGQRKVRIVTIRGEDAEQVSHVIQSAGGHVEEAVSSGGRGYIRAVVDARVVGAVMECAEVEWVEPCVPRRLLNDVAVQGPRLNVWNVWTNYGLTGRGQIVAVCDSGLDTGKEATLHPDFRGRVVAAFPLGRPGDWSDTDAHGTHVSGSAVGNGAASGGRFRGVAYEAGIVVQAVQDAEGKLSGLPDDLKPLFEQAYTNGARIHNNSWGASVDGRYTVDARNCDEYMWGRKDMLLVFGAGNDGVDLNKDGVIDLDCIVSPGTAKNVLTVGATENLRRRGGLARKKYGQILPVYYGAEPIRSDRISWPWDGVNQGMAGFSSRGPCDDGRVKPDVCAPGTDIISCRSRAEGAGRWWGEYDEWYVYMGGTSMSTPLAAGAATLVRQYLMERRGMTNPSAALIKAVLLNGARSLNPGQYGTGAAREIPGAFRPNNVEGWGQINVERSLYPPAGCTNIVVDAAGVETGETNAYYFVADGGKKLCVTLAWTDYPGSLGAAIQLVNDLDLIVVTPDGEVVYGNGANRADRVNNVEGIDFAEADAGVYTVLVVGHNVPFGPQPYALVLREDQRELAPKLWYWPTNVVIIGDGVAALVISNRGKATLEFALSYDKPVAGYHVSDSDATGGPRFAWINIRRKGREVTLSDDSVSDMVEIPFAFPYFGGSYRKIAIGANGGIGLSRGPVPPLNTRLATGSAPEQFLAVFWDDLDPAAGGKVYYYANTGSVVVTWEGVLRHGTREAMTFQAILHRSGEIVYQYKEMNGVVTSATVGIQGGRSGPASQVAFNEPYVKNNLAIRFRPVYATDWLRVNPSKGAVNPGRGMAVEIRCERSGATGEVNEAVLRLSHNAPVAEREVRVVMIVPEGGTLMVLLLAGWCVVARWGAKLEKVPF